MLEWCERCSPWVGGWKIEIHVPYQSIFHPPPLHQHKPLFPRMKETFSMIPLLCGVGDDFQQEPKHIKAKFSDVLWVREE